MVKLAFVVHNHQPVGNFDFVIEDTYNNAYRPFLETLRRFPSIKITIHFTGILLDWFSLHHPEFIVFIKDMVDSGQLEIMGGGYFEPILPILPERDRLGQLELSNRFIKEHFGAAPRGVWLAERVWEPQLAKTIGISGAEYVLLDDSHFKEAGLSDKELFGYYITEEGGIPLKILPGNKELRYLIPFDAPDKAIDCLKNMHSINSEEANCLVFTGDDGEKFGAWPGTYNTVYNEGWLESFFSLIEKNADWLSTVTCSEAVDEFSAIGNMYLPTASYSEMMEWVLPAELHNTFIDAQKKVASNDSLSDVLQFMKGGFWRNFLRKYPESNNMHKKMLEVSNIVQAAGANMPEDVFAEARRELYQGQCNCSYWHGIFGGLYLPHLRMSVYEHLLKAERIASPFIPERLFSFREEDFLFNGDRALVIKNEKIGVYINLSKGGSLFEFDYKPKAVNFLGVLSRRPEYYHEKIKELAVSSGTDSAKTINEIVHLKEEGLERRIHYDNYNRASFIEHFFDNSQTPEAFRDGKLAEKGDFVKAPYVCVSGQEGNTISSYLSREGLVMSNSLRVDKALHLYKNGSSLHADYRLLNRSDSTITCNFGVEFCVNPLHQDPDSTYIMLGEQRYALSDTGSCERVREAVLHVEGLGVSINISADREALVWCVPIDTVSQAESGMERNYQGTSFLIVWPIDLMPGCDWKVKLEKSVLDISA